MTKHVCLNNGTMVNTKDFSSPVPVVGLYIAAASLVCLLLIVCDVWVGLRTKKTWFPCRFFSFNSITLTLISVAAKIPVDLTTAMPSVQDQLSKLCGTVFICVTMCFMLPSVTTNAEFESHANVIALSIFVVTVVINICIQLATGVIFAFIPEHIIILVCMLLLLIRFWFTVSIMNGRKYDFCGLNTIWIRRGIENLLARLKDCYIFSYKSCLQLYACRDAHLADAGVVCTMSSVALAQAMIRSLGLKDFKFCEGVSDYGWSMWLVVVPQILTVAVVTLVVVSRLLTTLSPSAVLENPLSSLYNGIAYQRSDYILSSIGAPRFVMKGFRYVFYFPVFYINIAVTAANVLVRFMGGLLRVNCCTSVYEDKDSEEFRELGNRFPRVLVEIETCWVLMKGAADMEKWINVNRECGVKHISNMLSAVPPTELSSCAVGSDVGGVKLSSLSMILISTFMMRKYPTRRSNISNVLAEAFDIIQFIDSNLSTDRLQSSLAKSIYKYGSTSVVDYLFKPGFGPDIYVPTAANIASEDAMTQIGRIVNTRAPSEDPSQYLEAVYGRLERQFVDMIHAFLAQLPLAVFTHILESPVEEFHDRVKCGLGFLCRLEPLESQIRFSLPSGCDITSLFHAETSATNMQAQGMNAESQSTTVPVAEPAVEHGETQIWSTGGTCS